MLCYDLYIMQVLPLFWDYNKDKNITLSKRWKDQVVYTSLSAVSESHFAKNRPLGKGTVIFEAFFDKVSLWLK